VECDIAEHDIAEHDIAERDMEIALAAWARGVAEPTHKELIERLGAVALVATVKGPDGMRATLLTWHRRLGHLAFKRVLALAQSGVSGMVIMDVPAVVHALQQRRSIYPTRRATAV